LSPSVHPPPSPTQTIFSSSCLSPPFLRAIYLSPLLVDIYLASKVFFLPRPIFISFRISSLLVAFSAHRVPALCTHPPCSILPSLCSFSIGSPVTPSRISDRPFRGAFSYPFSADVPHGPRINYAYPIATFSLSPPQFSSTFLAHPFFFPP